MTDNAKNDDTHDEPVDDTKKSSTEDPVLSDDFLNRVHQLDGGEYRNENYEPPKEDPTDKISINPFDYPTPHKYMWMFRGIPMGQANGIDIPVISLPPEAQHALAVHMELLGMEHNPDNQIIYSLPPEAGPDNPMNPGRWVRKKEYDKAREEAIASMPGPEDEIDLDNIGFSKEQLENVEVEHLDALMRVIDAARMEKIKTQQADVQTNIDTDTSTKEDDNG